MKRIESMLGLGLGLWLAAADGVQGDVMEEPRRRFGLGSLLVAAVSADGRQLATAGDSAAYLWDFESGTVRHRLADHGTTVLAVGFSPDGSRLVTGARFGSVGVWSTADGSRVRLFRGHASDVNDIAFSADGRWFATAGADNRAVVWSMESGEPVRTVQVRGVSIQRCAFSPDGSRLVTADTGQTDNVRIWDLASGDVVHVLAGHESGALALGVLKDGTVVSGGQDRKVRLWNPDTGEGIRTLEAARQAVNQLAVVTEGNRLAVAAHDLKAWVYDTTTGNPLHEWSTDSVGSLVWVPGTENLVTVTSDHWLRVVDLRSGITQRALSGHTASTTFDVGFSPDGRQVISAGTEAVSRVWNRTNGAPVRVIEGAGSGSVAAQFSHDGRRVLTTTSVPRKSALILDAESGAVVKELAGHTDWILAATFSPDGKRVATSSMDRTVRVWNAETGQAIRTFHTGANFGYAVAFSPDGTRVADGGSSFDPTVHVWNIETGATEATLWAEAGSVRAVLFSASGSEIIVGWDEGLIRALDLKSGKIVAEWVAKGFVGDMALSPDGEWVVVGEGWPSFAARIVEWRTGRELRELRGHTAPVGAVAFDARGLQVLTGADVVRLWDVADLAARPNVERVQDGLRLSWKAGRLQRAERSGGPWTDVSGATSPHVVPVGAPQGFFRVIPEPTEGFADSP